MDQSVYRNRFVLANVLTAACMLLAKVWKTEAVPALREWRQNIYYVFLMSKVTAICKGQLGVSVAYEKLRERWAGYIEYVSSLINDCMMIKYLYFKK